MPERLIITNENSPGDYVVMSAAIRDLTLAYPGRFQFMVDCAQPAVYQGNPHITPFPAKTGRRVKATYDKGPYSIHFSNTRQHHFLWGYIGDLNLALKTNAVLTELRPDLHLTAEEKRDPIIPKPYWLFASGGKLDFPTKWWDFAYWQTVVDNMRKWVQVVQVGGGSHVHPKINGALDLVGKTSFRELMCLIYHSEGVMCPITCLMHIAAAFNKPCVVVAGGREHWWWEAYNHENRMANMRRTFENWVPPPGDDYTYHSFLHTIGDLACCNGFGCWKQSVDEGEKRCLKLDRTTSQLLPACMRMITPAHVLQAVESYYTSGRLSRRKSPTWVPAVTEKPDPRPEVVKKDHPLLKIVVSTPQVSEFASRSPYGMAFISTQRALEELKASTPCPWVVWMKSPYSLPLEEMELIAKEKDKAFGLVCWDPERKHYYLSKNVFMVPSWSLEGLDLDTPAWEHRLTERLKERGVELVDVGEAINYT